MPDFKSIAALGNQFGQLAKSLGNEGARQIAKAMGDEAQKLADSAGRADLGGDRMFTGGKGRGSGWHRIGPLDTKVRLLDPGELLLTPASRGAAAGWTTATRGRGNSNAGGFSGPGVNRRTGATNRTKAGKLRKVSDFRGGPKWSGYTKGKGTADDARALIEAGMPAVVERELAKVVAKFFD